jgi:voltage-gated potassium channel
MLVLCVSALAMQILQVAIVGDRHLSTLLERADLLLCAIFMIDFVVSLVRAPRKWRYFLTWGWLDLLSAIPAFQGARWGRLARIARLARVLRAMRESRAISSILFRDRGRAALFAAALLAFFLVIGSSAAILHFERAEGSNIQGADDALWWAFTTITTVGYGDRYPLTAEGRIIAVLLMTAGVGLFSALSGALAAWFLAPEDQATDAELGRLRADVAALRVLIEERMPKADAPPQ